MARHDAMVGDTRDFRYEIEDPAGRIAHLQDSLRIRKLNPAGSWDPNGTYTTADLLVQTWSPEALTGLLGFWAWTDAEGDDAVLFRVSADAGVTDLYWTGSAWVTPTLSTEWNTEEEIDAGVSTFPWEGSITTKVQFVSAAGTTTPSLTGFSYFWEPRYDPTVDLCKSLHKKIVEETWILSDYVFEVTIPDNVIEIKDALWDISEPVEVYNLTTDPKKTNNLFSSLSGNIVTLSSQQQGTLHVHYRGNLNESQVHVSSDSDIQELQELPAVIINNPVQARVFDDLLAVDPEQLRSIDTVRMRVRPTRHTYTVPLTCLAQNALQDKQLADAVREALDINEFVRSRATDEEMPLVGLERVSPQQKESDQQFARSIQVSVSVLEHMRRHRDVPMVQEINFNSAPTGRSSQFDGENTQVTRG